MKMTSQQQAAEWGKTLQAGDYLTYEQVNALRDMMTDELVKLLRNRGLRMNREDTDCIWIEAIEVGTV